MYKTITQYDFEDAFNSWETYKNNFSYEGKKALFNYLEEYEVLKPYLEKSSFEKVCKTIYNDIEDEFDGIIFRKEISI